MRLSAQLQGLIGQTRSGCWQPDLLMSAAKPSHGCSVPTFHRHPHPCNVLLSARRASKQATEQAHSKAQCLTPTKGCVSRRGGSLSDSFRFVPPSQHLSERREKRSETDKESERGKGRHLCLPVEWDVSFKHILLSLSQTHTHTHARMIQFSDSVITCWWGTASTAQWGGVCLCNQTVCAGPEARRRHSSWLVCVLNVLWRRVSSLSLFAFDTLHNIHLEANLIVMTITYLSYMDVMTAQANHNSLP